jgi:sterol desaturase/sphingolipid hydroxylase (fatty acid hydroxylase superfamily)
LVLFAFGAKPDPITLFGANFIFSIFHLLGANMRHSHIWLSFGPILERIIISPAQHQIHHSKAPRHWDRNYGEVFAIWDWLFGTLYLPGKEREIIEFGAVGDDTQAHPTLFAAYVQPFRDCARLLADYRRRFLTRGAARVSAHSGDE